VEDDRVWAVYADDGRIGSGKSTRRFRRIDGLLSLWAFMDGDRPSIAFSDGTTVRIGDPDTDQRVSHALNRQVFLRTETTMPHHDVSPLHMITTASLRRIERLLGARVDVRRLRPNIILDIDDPNIDENSWHGQNLRIGSTVVITVGDAMSRCAMVGLAQDGLPDEPRLLRLLAREFDLKFGFEISVLHEGSVTVGDDVRRA
jgi:uncharacterized protein